MRVHGGQKTITELHSTRKGPLTSSGYPTSLLFAEEQDDMTGILRERVGIVDQGIRKREMMVLETLPRLSELVVFDVQLRGGWTVYHTESATASDSQCSWYKQESTYQMGFRSPGLGHWTDGMVGETIVTPPSSPGLVYRAIAGRIAVVVVVVAAAGVVVVVVVVVMVREATVRSGTRMALVGGIAADMSVGRTIEELVTVHCSVSFSCRFFCSCYSSSSLLFLCSALILSRSLSFFPDFF